MNCTTLHALEAYINLRFKLPEYRILRRNFPSFMNMEICVYLYIDCNNMDAGKRYGIVVCHVRFSIVVRITGCYAINYDANCLVFTL